MPFNYENLTHELRNQKIEYENMKSSHNSRIKAMRETYDSEVKAMAKSHECDIAKKMKYNKKLSARNEQIEQQIRDLQNQAQKQVPEQDNDSEQVDFISEAAEQPEPDILKPVNIFQQNPDIFQQNPDIFQQEAEIMSAFKHATLNRPPGPNCLLYETEIKHIDHINSMSFSATSKMLATGSEDGEVRVTDLATGNILLSIKYDGWVGSVGLSALGKILAAGYQDGTV